MTVENQVAPDGSREHLILASTSPTRRRLLAAAGVPIEAVAPAVDEAALTQSLLHEGAAPAAIAEALAELKGLSVSRRHPGRIVLGADQVLACNGVLFDKPADRAHAAAALRALRGRGHELHTAAVAVRDGTAIWRHVAQASLTMRAFSDRFLEDYLAQVGDAAMTSVGGYQLEGPGAQLFSRVEGDYFAILGLPLLPLLAWLRQQAILAT